MLTATTISNMLGQGGERRAIGGFANLPPRLTTFTARLADTGDVVSRITVLIRADEITRILKEQLDMRPAGSGAGEQAPGDHRESIEEQHACPGRAVHASHVAQPGTRPQAEIGEVEHRQGGDRRREPPEGARGKDASAQGNVASPGSRVA